MSGNEKKPLGFILEPHKSQHILAVTITNLNFADVIDFITVDIIDA
jgi:hypothetical protein